jgi:ribosomal protein S18 acetylase RimI-like enzyme
MSTEPDLYYFCRPSGPVDVLHPVDFLSVAEFVADEPACRQLWDLISTQFRTRGKFLTIWQAARFVAVHRDPAGAADGFLLVSTPINWQIDYVVVRPDRRGNGIAGTLVAAAMDQAYRRGAPYVMLTSRPSLRSFYEGCGFTVVGTNAVIEAATTGASEPAPQSSPTCSADHTRPQS